MFKEDFINLNSFNDFYLNASKYSDEEKKYLFVEFVKYFLISSDLTNDIYKIWSFKELPQYIQNKLISDNKKNLLDLIILTNKGERYAIKCEFDMDKNKMIDIEKESFFELIFEDYKLITFSDPFELSKEYYLYAKECGFITEKKKYGTLEEMIKFSGLIFGGQDKFNKGFFLTNAKTNKNSKNYKNITIIDNDFFNNFPEKFLKLVKCYSLGGFD